MPHKSGHTNTGTTYKIYGTNQPYNGMAVEIGGYMYSTVGGALEGDSYQLVPLQGSPNVDPNQTPIPDMEVPIPRPAPPTPGNSQNNNPVVRTFRNRRDGSNRLEYLRLDGSDAAQLLHEHQDGTIMEGHNPNQMGAIVELNPLFGTAPDDMPPIIGGETGGGTPSGPQPNPSPGMSGQSNPQGGKTGPGQSPTGGY